MPEIPHGYVRSPRKSYKENELMQFFCDEGYKYGNRADALCTKLGWNPPPYCTGQSCLKGFYTLVGFGSNLEINKLIHNKINPSTSSQYP